MSENQIAYLQYFVSYFGKGEANQEPQKTEADKQTDSKGCWY